MQFVGFAVLAGILAVGALGETPTVCGLLHNYRFTVRGLSHYYIAQGSTRGISAGT